ncbi:MAG: 2-oxoacid:acceptor oxidoreductase subunit alpha [Nitrospirota bacterium]
MDYSIKIGGEAGQGIQTIGDTLARVFSRSGYHVFTHQDYESRVRGGHNFFQIRISEKPVAASRTGIDILVALDKESISLHAHELTESGLLIYDASYLGHAHEKLNFLDIPFLNIAAGYGNKIMANTVATGAVLGMLRLNLEILSGIIRDTFGKKGEAVIEANLHAARSGHEYAMKNCPKCSFVPAPAGNPKLMMSGIEGIAFGALAAGCRFYSAYPMTPSTGIMNYLAGREKEYGIIVEQAEDEVAAINMAIGASFAGVRAMTGTAGGGFALMAEGLSLAGMTETPVVIALGQRPAPATGLPTRTEQGDLLFALHAGHGEFPRVIFAPGTPEQAFSLTGKAFDMAEKFQIPAIVIFDQYLGDTGWTFDDIELKRVTCRDYRLRGDEFKKTEGYKRYAFTESGISPMGVPGDSENLVIADSDEHDEDGHIIEDAETRNRMVRKRLFAKMPLIRQEIGPPVFYGSRQPEILICGWGSTYGIMKEAVELLKKDTAIAMLHFSEIYPLPSTDAVDYLALLRNAKVSVCIEHNATGQFAHIMRAETGFEFISHIHRYDGRPFLVEELTGEISAGTGRL